MYTERPVPSVVAGTVTLNTSVTVRSWAVPDTDADGADRLNDRSSASDPVVPGLALGDRGVGVAGVRQPDEQLPRPAR